jgi:predicted nucleic acid-binding protein
MQPALLDASIYISALRARDHRVLGLRNLAPDSPLWLSAVVLEELYAGISDRHRHIAERLERDFVGSNRILPPTLRDWAQAGRILSRLAEKYDYEQIGRGTVDQRRLDLSECGTRGNTSYHRESAGLGSFVRVPRAFSGNWQRFKAFSETRPASCRSQGSARHPF